MTTDSLERCDLDIVAGHVKDARGYGRKMRDSLQTAYLEMNKERERYPTYGVQCVLESVKLVLKHLDESSQKIEKRRNA